MISTMIAVLYGQLRVFMSMSRDGLLPKIFCKIHSRHRTPFIDTIVASVIVEFVNIGTLISFIIVFAGVIYFRKTMPNFERKFRCLGVPLQS